MEVSDQLRDPAVLHSGKICRNLTNIRVHGKESDSCRSLLAINFSRSFSKLVAARMGWSGSQQKVWP